MSIKLVSATDETLTFEVTSSSRNQVHEVYFDTDNGWVCSCEHHYYRKAECKHIKACKEWLMNNHNFTVVGISCYGILEYDNEMIITAQNMGTYNEIKNRRMEECNFQQEMKLKA